MTTFTVVLNSTFMNQHGYTIHALPCGISSGHLTVNEPALLVAASFVGQAGSASNADPSGLSVGSAPAQPWQPAFAGSDPNSGALGTGICPAGFDGLPYAPGPEPAGSAIAFCLRYPPTLLYVATRSVQTPTYTISSGSPGGPPNGSVLE